MWILRLLISAKQNNQFMYCPNEIIYSPHEPIIIGSGISYDNYWALVCTWQFRNTNLLVLRPVNLIVCWIWCRLCMLVCSPGSQLDRTWKEMQMPQPPSTQSCGSLLLFSRARLIGPQIRKKLIATDSQRRVYESPGQKFSQLENLRKNKENSKVTFTAEARLMVL